jgi:transposase
MTHIAGFERDQLLLLPEAVDDYVEIDNPVRFIEAFVDGLDLAGAGFARVEAKATGRPGYAPGDLLKLYIYGRLHTCVSRLVCCRFVTFRKKCSDPQLAVEATQRNPIGAIRVQ